ncbi:MAG: hypothetical protein U0556_02975 [Dehalococcoidia bacterium]
MTLSILIVGVLVGAVSLLILTEAWRIGIPALLAVYLIVALLLGAETNLALGAVHLLVGLFTVGVLFAALRTLPGTLNSTVQYAFGFPYRIVTGLFALVVAYSLADTYPLPDVAPGLNFAVYLLAAVGLISLVLARRVLTVGYAVLLLQEVASILLSIFSEGPGLARLLLAALVQFAMAVAVAYLLYIEQEGETT